jgi:ubiquinone/menaquinone biosynthesis C-methylase UbiE
LSSDRAVRKSRPRSLGIAFALGAATAQWAQAYRAYRRDGQRQTAYELDLLRAVDRGTFRRHYDERVPTVEEEFELWGRFHQHRHEMRYDLVAAAVRQHLPVGGRVLDIGAGAVLVGDRIADVAADYVALEFSERNVARAAAKFTSRRDPLSVRFVRGDAECLPLADASCDVVVMSEVIEHLMHPDRAVWEISRVLRAGGVFVMTTNNASEMPCISPLRNPLAWVEKALGATRPRLISLRPWAWPASVDADILPPGVPQLHLPHTHHIYEETRRLFAAGGLDTFEWSTFEFPPPQSATDRWLEARGPRGTRVVDAIETVCRRVPLVQRLGCHLFMQSRKVRPPVAAEPPPELWPGPKATDAAEAPAVELVPPPTARSGRQDDENLVDLATRTGR